MTAVNFMLSPGAVVVMTDTLLTTDADNPAAFVTKAVAIPHLGALISGRGTSELVLDWAHEVLFRRPLASFDDLIAQTQAALLRRWREIADRAPPTSTVFTWGFSRAAGRVVGYAFRSTADFAPEALEDGLRFAPTPDDADLEAILASEAGDLAKLRDGMVAAKASNDQDPPDERCHIGGSIIMHALLVDEDGGVEISAQVVHDFDDRLEQLALAYMAAA